MDIVSNKEHDHVLIASITNFVKMLLEGDCHHDVIPIFFNGRLIALAKKSGGIRPIAIGHTLRRIVVKCDNNCVLTFLGHKLLSEQLGLGYPSGCEGTIHATQRFLSNRPTDFVIPKLDFSNAFNSLHRDVMLPAVAKNTPDIYRFCRCQVYF